MKLLKRIFLLVAIAVAHAGLGYALYVNVLAIRSPQPVAIKEIIASLVAPPLPKEETPPPRPESQPPPPPKPPQPPPRQKPPAAAVPAPQAQPAPAAPSPPAPAIAAADAASAQAAPPSPSPAPPAPVQPRTVSSGIEVLHMPKPEYPALSRRMGEEGTVVLRILINERGQPDPAKITVHQSSGYFRLDEAARQAAMQASFKPYLDNGRAVPVFALLPIKFRIDG